MPLSMSICPWTTSDVHGTWPVASPRQQKGLTLNEDQAFFIGRATQTSLASQAAGGGLRACCQPICWQ